MAQKVTVALEDDLDGGPADETVRFGLGGTDYEIDLSTKNANAFRRKIAPFIERARRAGRGQRRRPARTASSRERSADIRAWAKDRGHHGQRARAHPRERSRAVRRRDLRILTPGYGRRWSASGSGRPTAHWALEVQKLALRVRNTRIRATRVCG